MRTEAILNAALLGIYALAFQGCVYCHRTTDSCSYYGKVVDQQTSKPIYKAHIELFARDHTANAKTDTNGCFMVGPLKSTRFGVGIPPDATLIGEEYSYPQSLVLTVSKNGYLTKENAVQARPPSDVATLNTIFLHRK